MTSTSTALSERIVSTTPTTFRAQAEFFEESSRPPSGKSRRKPKTQIADGLTAPSPVGKNFILDTNVLLHDPECLNCFADNHVCIPLEVLCELDKFKGEQSERGANARNVHRTLSALFTPSPENAARGIPTAEGGSVRLVICRSDDRRTKAAITELTDLLPEVSSPDHRILLCTKIVDSVNSAPAVLITKDLNLQLKALALGIKCEDYESDKVASEADERKLHSLQVIPTDLQRFASSGKITLEDPAIDALCLNDYILLEAGPSRTMPARYVGDGEFVRLRHPDTIRIHRGTPLRPLNLGQQCFLDALLNPEISLVTCYGQAGTGKTLLAVAAALYATMAGDYNGVTVSRPVVAMGDTLGFLPGSLSEKLDPWLKPIFDALEFLLAPEKRPDRGIPKKKGTRKAPSGSSRTAPQDSEPAKKVYQPFLDSGVIEVEALCYIRGRSIPKRFFILDEAQQLTPLEAKTIVTRMAQGSKLILVGDPAQIDNPYVDRRSNGLVYTRDKLRNQPCSAHVALERGERSELAEAGARLM